MRKFLSMALALVAALTMTAQNVDKAKVTGNADAAKKAGADLQKLEQGEKAWKFDGTVGLNVAATGLVNWAAGGKNNVNGIAFAKLHLLYHKDAIAWETNFDTDFGMTWIQQKEDPFQKSSDNIKLATKFGWEFKPTWYLTVLGSFQSQYALGRNYQEGYNDVISKWLAPSYTDISVGIDWKKSVNGADFSLYLSPVAGRITTATDPRLREKYGVDTNKTYRAVAGLTFKAALTYTRIENLKILSTLTLFTPYTKKFGNFNVDWDFMISYQFLKVLNVSLMTSLKYYDEVMITDRHGNTGPRVQFKEVLGLGIGYSF